MSTLASPNPAPSNCGWHHLYQAALFERDRSKIPTRIEQAERAILARISELLLLTCDHIEEDQTLSTRLRPYVTSLYTKPALLMFYLRE